VRALLVYPDEGAQPRPGAGTQRSLRFARTDVTVGVYDGDTKREEKARIREEANVVITNFAGLNQYLEGHYRWPRSTRSAN